MKHFIVLQFFDNSSALHSWLNDEDDKNKEVNEAEHASCFKFYNL